MEARSAVTHLVCPVRSRPLGLPGSQSPSWSARFVVTLPVRPAQEGSSAADLLVCSRGSVFCLLLHEAVEGDTQETRQKRVGEREEGGPNGIPKGRKHLHDKA